MDDKNLHNILFSEPKEIATCCGTPILAYGYTWVVGAPPQLAPDQPMQAGNKNRVTKLRLKTSSEIKSNRLGVNATRLPHSPAVDYLPLEAIHLIDGDKTTCWCSHSAPNSTVDEPWIRIDLPTETSVSRIVLRKRIPGTVRNVLGSIRLDKGAVEIGTAMPERLEVSMSRDAENWITIFSGAVEGFDQKSDFEFDAMRTTAKQILITGRNLARVENWLFGFSIASVEVYDAKGENVALATHGTGVSVSSTQHCFGQTIEAHRQLWPMTADLGVKSVRVGYHDDPINWHWVERERGKLVIDYKADAAITWLAENGIGVVMALGFGNRLYTQADPVRHLPQLWEWYYENPAPPTTPDALEAWARYVRFMARNFRDRVRCFEVWNEWNSDIYWGGPPSIDAYLAVAKIAIPIIHEEAPGTPVSLGGAACFPWGMSKWTTDDLRETEADSATPVGMFLAAIRELGKEVDAIQWHPAYQPHPSKLTGYSADVRALMNYCRDHLFRGEFIASEWTFGASYPPPTPPNWWGNFVCSEIQKAKYVAQMTVRHASLGVTSIFCEQWHDTYPLDLSLMRRTVFSDPQSRQQPQAAYYVMRNLATALDSTEPGDFAYEIASTASAIEHYGLCREGERAIAVWQPGLASDYCDGVEADVSVAGEWDAVAFDCLNGSMCPLIVRWTGNRTTISGLFVKDYPLLVQLTPKPI
ncbi:MAG: discoidin domain-containing protein [Capsulimonadaceae bacterium]|nr:discoidin domain-containing protein [Capsulimonadaceae bacterium]